MGEWEERGGLSEVWVGLYWTGGTGLDWIGLENGGWNGTSEIAYWNERLKIETSVTGVIEQTRRGDSRHNHSPCAANDAYNRPARLGGFIEVGQCVWIITGSWFLRMPLFFRLLFSG